MSLTVINPTTGESIRTYPEHSPEEIEFRLARAAGQFIRWRATPIEQRSSPMRRVGEILRDRKAQLAELMTTEMGKPIAAAEAEIDKCAGCCEFFADKAAKWLAPEMVV